MSERFNRADEQTLEIAGKPYPVDKWAEDAIREDERIKEMDQRRVMFNFYRAEYYRMSLEVRQLQAACRRKAVHIKRLKEEKNEL